MLTIEQIDAVTTPAYQDSLVALLQDAVASGASIGFLPPLTEAEARAYWDAAQREVAAGTRLLLVARDVDAIVGSVQLALATKPNAAHRAEVQKLMVHTAARGQGLGRVLLAAVEDAARAAGRTLLVLDTRAGDIAEGLYARHGYTRAGRIPGYVRERDGILQDTVIFYRHLDGR